VRAGAALSRLDLQRGRAATSASRARGECHIIAAAAVLFHRAMAVGAAKSVTFGNKKSVKFENSFQKVLEIKKISKILVVPSGIMK
jgi:hypothetical protein